MEKYYIAYLDFLGAKVKIKNNFSETYNNLEYIYEKLIKFLEKENELEKYGNIYPEIKINLFSDNIAIFTKKQGKASEFEILLKTISYIQAIALKKGFPMRGGISEGDFAFKSCKNKNNNLIADFILGNSLVEAVHLEENLAIYPRVILSPEINYNSYLNYLRVDNDGFRYVEYFSSLYKEFKKEAKSPIQTPAQIKNLLEQLYKNEAKHNKNYKIIQKYNWLIDKYNNYCLEQNWDMYKIKLNMLLS